MTQNKNIKFKKRGRFSLDGLIENSKFDYCKNLKWFLVAPLVICLVGVIILCTLGFNLGIDFTGGSVMTIFIDSQGSHIVSVEENPNAAPLDLNADYGKIERKIASVLSKYGLSIATLQKSEVHDDYLSGDAVVLKFQNGGTSDVEAQNDEIRLALLKEFGFIALDSTESIEQIDDLNPEIGALVASQGTTTASASAELMMKSFIALLVAVLLILIYVAFRFELTSGLAAILALFHDVLVTASLVLIFRLQINVAFIAALITILGYSINNTIIIFDRMREKLKTYRTAEKKVDNKTIANGAIKDTMTRSILTMLTTFVMIFFITVIGVADIREFAFPIMIGVLAGFYSSVFITPGLWAIAYRPRNRKKPFQKSNGKKVNEGVVVETKPQNTQDAETF